MTTKGKIGTSNAVSKRSAENGYSGLVATIHEVRLATLRANAYSELKHPPQTVQPTALQLMYWQIMSDKMDVRPMRLEDMEKLLLPSGMPGVGVTSSGDHS
jgi:hypothetical protein